MGDILDLHNYPDPSLYLYDGGRATVLGEYGGIGLALKDHLWEPNRNWGYVRFNSPEEVTNEYVKYAEKLKLLAANGFSAAVYTQTTDVEIEINGLLTYDRAVVKVDEARVKKVNEEVINSIQGNENFSNLTNKNMIRHTVAFRLKPGTSAAEQKQFFDELQKLSAIRGVQNFSMQNQVGKKNNFKHGVVMDFSDQAVYDDYNNHPTHVAFLENYWKKYVEDFVELDYKL